MDDIDETTANQACLSPEETVSREPRFESCGSRKATVVIQRTSGDEGELIEATLLDISPGGGKLIVDECIRFDEVLRLKIKVADLNVDFAVAAGVCWTRPANEDGWLLGCAFKPKLPENALDQLASSGYIDRRRHMRLPLNVPATASWELSEASVPVLLQDASDGGFAMISPHDVETGQRLILQLNLPEQEPASIPATVQWRMKSGDEYLIGCSFQKTEVLRTCSWRLRTKS